MRTTIYLILAIAWLLYLSEPTISFKPFSIEFAKPYTPFGWLFLMIALVLFDLQSHKTAYEEGVSDTLDTLREHVKEMRREEKL
jgi:hypothetical protein